MQKLLLNLKILFSAKTSFRIQISRRLPLCRPLPDIGHIFGVIFIPVHIGKQSAAHFGSSLPVLRSMNQIRLFKGIRRQVIHFMDIILRCNLLEVFIIQCPLGSTDSEVPEMLRHKILTPAAAFPVNQP